LETVNYRKATVLESEDATTAKTKTIDLNLTDIISRIQVKFNATNTDIVPTAVHAKQISKIEIVSGSDVLYSLSGEEIEGKMFYDYKNGPSYEREFRNGIDNYLLLDLLFGRKLWDKELAFDPTKFKNPQLKITHNKALGGSLPNAATLEVFADCFDEKTIAPIGYIMSKEFHTFTTPASAANEYIVLPNDYPIKRIMVQTYKTDYWWENIVTSLTIDEENAKRKPIDHNGNDLVSMIHTMYGEYRELIVDNIRVNQTEYITPTDSAYFLISALTDSAGGYCATDAERTGGYQTIHSNATVLMRAMACGYLPHGCLPLDLGDPMDLEDWFDVTRKGKIQFIPKTLGSATFNTVLEQLRKY
jgi:hypothetical protein